MRILTVWDGDYPWDVRVEKICKTLLAHGHEAHLVCRNSRGLARKDIIDGIQVRRVFAFSGNLARFNGAITFPFFFSPIWLREIKKAVTEIKPDVVIIRDLPIALAVFPATLPAKIPTVLDMAECYPEMIRCAWKFERFNPLNALIRNPFLADLVENSTLRKIDAAWVMIEESADRLRAKGLAAEKIRIVSNTPTAARSGPEDRTDDTDLLQILYVGLVNPSRGLKTLVEAADIMRRQFSAFKIKIVGSGKDLPRISGLIEQLKLQDHVEMTGWIKQTELAPLYRRADVGVVPHYKCSHWDHTIPNKIFDYMSASIPVVVSNATPTERIIKETGAGVVYDSFSAEDLAAKLLSLRDHNLRERLGANGNRSVLERYNWDRDSATLLDSLQKLSGRSQGKS